MGREGQRRVSSTRLTWLLWLQQEVPVRVQAQHLAELLDVLGGIGWLDQHHVAGSVAGGRGAMSAGLGVWPAPWDSAHSPHLMPEPAMSNSIRRTSWKCVGPVTRWLLTTGARKGRASVGAPRGSATCGSSGLLLGDSWRNCRVNLAGRLWGGAGVTPGLLSGAPPTPLQG